MSWHLPLARACAHCALGRRQCAGGHCTAARHRRRRCHACRHFILSCSQGGGQSLHSRCGPCINSARLRAGGLSLAIPQPTPCWPSRCALLSTAWPASAAHSLAALFFWQKPQSFPLLLADRSWPKNVSAASSRSLLAMQLCVMISSGSICSFTSGTLFTSCATRGWA
jgi:hypothetical protein